MHTHKKNNYKFETYLFKMYVILMIEKGKEDNITFNNQKMVGVASLIFNLYFSNNFKLQTFDLTKLFSAIIRIH
jgi:hypothetical protein